MPVRKYTVTDGITSETQTYVGAPRSRSELREDLKAIRGLVKEHNQRCTFDGLVVDLERACRRTSGVRRKADHPRPAFGSRAWYAEEILTAIQAVRSALTRNEPDLAASEAVIVGALATEAEAKFRWGHVLLQAARRDKNRELSQRAAAARRAATIDRDSVIITASKVYRDKHPRHSTRTMAAVIAKPLDLKAGTVRDRLRKLNIR